MQNFPILCRIYLFTDMRGCGPKTEGIRGVKISRSRCQRLEKSQMSLNAMKNFKIICRRFVPTPKWWICP